MIASAIDGSLCSSFSSPSFVRVSSQKVELYASFVAVRAGRFFGVFRDDSEFKTRSKWAVADSS
jgi:hypothetical protein